MKKIFVILTLALSGCVTVHNISNSSFERKINDQNTDLIQSKETGIGILHIAEPELHVIDKLRGQCKNGIVHGIETKLTSREFILVQAYALEAVGHCTKD